MKHGDDAAVPRRVSSRLSARTTTTTTSSTASVATTHDPTPVPSSCIDTTSLLLERHTVDAREPAQIAGDAHIAVDHDQVDAAHAVTAHAAVTAIEIVDLVSPVDDEPVTNNATGDGNVLAVQVDEVASDDDELPAYGAHLLSRVTPVSSKRRQRTTVVEEEEVAAADERRRVARTMREGGVAVTAVANTAATAATTATTNSPVPSNSSSSDDERHSTAKRKPRPAARPVARPAIAASGSNPIDDWYSVSVRMPTVSLRKHLVHTPAAAGAATAADNANINGDESGAGKTHDMETLTNLDKKALAFQRRLLRQASRASSTEDAVKDAMSSTGNTTNACMQCAVACIVLLCFIFNPVPLIIMTLETSTPLTRQR